MARQYHFQFPSEEDARRFARLVAWTYRDVALHRSGCWVSVVDGGGRDRGAALLAAALRVGPAGGA